MAEGIERKKLIDYLPPIMQNFSEFKQIMKVEQPEMDLLDAGIQRVLDNAFIADCDGYGIKKYEAILHILRDADDTLDLRKLRVLIRWNEFAPYTYRVLIRKLNVICGVNGYDILPDLENYILKISIHLSVVKQRAEVERFIERVIPMNMNYEVTIKYNTHKVLTNYTHKYLSRYTHKQIREEEL